MAVSEPQVEATRFADPRRVADVTLAAAIRCHADAVYIEPMAMADDTYVITLERASHVLSTVPLDAQLGAAVIARLAFLADIDLSAAHAVSGVLPVRSGTRQAEIMITVRPGTSLCADLMVMPQARARAAGLDGDPAAVAELHVKLVDFGLAELAGEGLRDEDPEFVLGTPAYISPEQLRGLAPTDRSDQYGLGAVLFELLTGHPPFHHDDLRSLCMMHLTAAIPAIESPHGPLPPKLADIVTTCLQKTPQARFPGMLVALDEIERVTDRRGWRRWLSS
jgi:hypothetical protein